MTAELDDKDSTEFLTDWKAGGQVSVHNLRLGADEELGQKLALATLEELRALGYDPATWNDVPDAEWEKVQSDLIAKNAPTFDKLSADVAAMAMNLGVNYFEHGHEAILNGTPVEDRLTLSKT